MRSGMREGSIALSGVRSPLKDMARSRRSRFNIKKKPFPNRESISIGLPWVRLKIFVFGAEKKKTTES